MSMVISHSAVLSASSRRSNARASLTGRMESEGRTRGAEDGQVKVTEGGDPPLTALSRSLMAVLMRNFTLPRKDALIDQVLKRVELPVATASCYDHGWQFEVLCNFCRHYVLQRARCCAARRL